MCVGRTVIAAALLYVLSETHAAAQSPAAMPDPPPSPAEPNWSGPVIGGDAGFGMVLQADARLGWMVMPRLALFGTVIGGAGGVEGDSGITYHMWGIGARGWFWHEAFLDARIGRARTTTEGLINEPPYIRTGTGFMLEIGLEHALNGYLGAELHLGLISTPDMLGIFLGVGASVY